MITAARKAKSDAHTKMRHPIARMTVTDTPDRLALIDAIAADLRAAGVIAELDLHRGRRSAQMSSLPLDVYDAA